MDLDDDCPNPDTPDDAGRTRLQSGDPSAATAAVAQDDPPISGQAATRARRQTSRRHLWCCPWKNDKREKLWKEVCRPGAGPSGSLLPTGLVVLAGLFILILVFGSGSLTDSAHAPKPRPVTHPAPPCPRSAAVLLGRVAVPDVTGEQEFVSEAGEDAKVTDNFPDTTGPDGEEQK